MIVPSAGCHGPAASAGCHGQAKLARAAVTSLLLALASASCKPATSPASARPAQACIAELPPAEPWPSELPIAWDDRDDDATRSELGVQILLSAASIADRLETEVPRDSAAAHLNAGAAGLVTYTARRTPFSATLRDRTLHFTSQLSAHAEVCKPLGPLGCVAYASCDPGAVADASLPLDPDEDWSLGPSRVSVVVTRPCIVGPIDATPMIQRGASQQAAALRSRLNAALPSLRSKVRAAWRAAPVRVDLPGAPMSFAPIELTVAPAEVRDGALHYAVQVVGRVGERARPFSDALPPPRPVPASSPSLSLRVPVRLGVDHIDRALRASLASARLSSADSWGAVTSAQAHPTRDGLLVWLQLEGSLCGRLAVLASPSLDPARHVVVLRQVKAPAWQRAALVHRVPEVQLRAFELFVQEHAELPIPPSDSELSSTIGAAVDRFRPEGASVEVAARSLSLEQVLLDPAGLVVVARYDQKAAIALR